MKKTTENLVGKKFNKLIVESLDYVKQTKWGTVLYWVCKCECGNTKSIRRDHLVLNKTLSCGCHRKQLQTNLQHGECTNKYRTKEHSIWTGIKKRCFGEYDISYKHYGGRGITLCDRWLNYENFLADMGRCPKGMSIERIDVNGNYEPSNCKWATAKEQGLNKRTSLGIVIDGKKANREEAMAILKISRKNLYLWISNSNSLELGVWA